MGYWIKRVSKVNRQFRINIPGAIIKAKGWENALYVKIDDQWGDRIVITRVADSEEGKANDKSDRD